MAQKPVGMHIADVKAELHKRFGAVEALARRLAGAPGLVSRAPGRIGG
jgi:hypothetical protein